LNYVFSKPDTRDFRYKTYFTADVDALPERVDLREHWSDVMDQGDLGSCVANAIAGAIRATRSKNKMSVYDPSRLFIYYFARVLDGTDPKEDAGTYIRSGFKAVNKNRVCSERNWPYKIADFSVEPNKNAQKAATQHRKFNYLSLDGAPEEIKHSLASGYPVVFGTAVYRSFMTKTVAQTGLVPNPDKTKEECLGGHAMVIVGYNNSQGHYVVANSWGADWGDKGFCYIPFEYIHDSVVTSDFWSPRDFS
jgi:C1A family cysteine protease